MTRAGIAGLSSARFQAKSPYSGSADPSTIAHAAHMRLLRTEDAFRGFIASKRRYFYGLKIFLMTTHAEHPVEVFFTPGSYSDSAQLKQFAFDLAEARQSDDACSIQPETM